MKQPVLGAVSGALLGFITALVTGAGNPWSDLSVERHTGGFLAVILTGTIGGVVLEIFANRKIPRSVFVPLIVFFGLCLVHWPHPKTGDPAPFGLLWLVVRLRLPISPIWEFLLVLVIQTTTTAFLSLLILWMMRCVGQRDDATSNLAVPGRGSSADSEIDSHTIHS